VRPTAVEALRGLQRGLASALAPEAGAAFAEDAVRTSQMLLESVIGELAAGDAHVAADSETLRSILKRGAEAVRGIDSGLAAEIVTALGGSTGGERLDGLLERLLVVCEDAVGGGRAGADLLAVRPDAYGHLRRVAARGWSFWDMVSFREFMARLRAEET
jgi:hypothetical protein